MDECDYLLLQWIGKIVFVNFKFFFYTKKVKEYWTHYTMFARCMTQRI